MTADWRQSWKATVRWGKLAIWLVKLTKMVKLLIDWGYVSNDRLSLLTITWHCRWVWKIGAGLQLLATGNFNPLQLAYRSSHPTETALPRIQNNFYQAIDDKKLTVKISISISAAFDTIYHGKLLSRFRHGFGVTDKALKWLKSYIADRQRLVEFGRHSSAKVRCSSGVPQGSVLGPLIFVAYVSPIGEVISIHGVDHHQYADDTQLFLAIAASTIRSNLSTLEICSQACLLTMTCCWMLTSLRWRLTHHHHSWKLHHASIPY